MKPYHEELSSKGWSMWQHYILPKRFLFKALSNCYTFALLTAWFLYFWYVMEPFLHPSKKAFLSSSVCPRENIPGHSTENMAYWFILKIARIFPILKSRNRIMDTLMIANIIPTCKRVHNISLCFSIPKRPSFYLQFCQEQNILGHSFEKRVY